MTQQVVGSLDAIAHRVHEANSKWWHDLETGVRLRRNLGELFMLVVSELSEAMEGHRKDLMDDKLPHRKMAEVELADALIRLLDIAGSPEYRTHLDEGHRYLYRWSDNFASNLFLIIMRLRSVLVNRAFSAPLLNEGPHVKACVNIAVHGVIELAAREHMDIWGAFEDKMRYNSTRADHTREGRMEAHGKKY